MNQHLRRLALAGALATVIAACGGGEVAEAPAPAPATTAAGQTGSVASGSSTDPTTGSTAGSTDTTAAQVDPDAVPAPDFTLALGGGGEFALSEEAKPVYMVFWAEW
jgi:hypothetical protein